MSLSHPASAAAFLANAVVGCGLAVRRPRNPIGWLVVVAREIESFAARVRDEVEVDRLTVTLATTLEPTMQPASVGTWLRRT